MTNQINHHDPHDPKVKNVILEIFWIQFWISTPIRKTNKILYHVNLLIGKLNSINESK